MKTVWTDRSRIETYQSCPRKRWLEYHQNGTGISPAKKPLPLAVGGSVHVGLEHLLLGEGEDAAVAAALADFSTHKSALALDLTEASALAAAIDPRDAGFDAQVLATAADLGMDANDPAMAELLGRQRNAAAEFDAWLWQEQAALVEGMVRAWARRRLGALLEEYEVLEVEREEAWQLTHWDQDRDGVELKEVVFMSRPDALLRSRADNSLYILSFKTAATWDVRKERDAEHDMQGLSEGVGIERRLGDLWHRLQINGSHLTLKELDGRMLDYLSSLPAPPRILGIRYEYLLKGARYADRDLSARFGLNVWAQRSHLIRAYADSTASQWCWSYDFLKDDGSSSKLYYKNWRPRAVWESMPVRDWIDMLDQSVETMSAYDSTTGVEPRSLGFSSPAQAQGFTPRHPLDEVFPAPRIVYRSDDQLRDWIDQVEAQEVRVAEGVAAVEAAGEDAGDRRHALNVHFPMSRRSCSYPSECPMTKVCYGGSDIQQEPMASGLFRIRKANHPQEAAGAPGSESLRLRRRGEAQRVGAAVASDPRLRRLRNNLLRLADFS